MLPLMEGRTARCSYAHSSVVWPLPMLMLPVLAPPLLCCVHVLVGDWLAGTERCCRRCRRCSRTSLLPSCRSLPHPPPPPCRLSSLDLRSPVEILRPGLPAIAELSALTSLALDFYVAGSGGSEDLMLTVVAPPHLQNLVISSDRNRCGAGRGAVRLVHGRGAACPAQGADA